MARVWIVYFSRTGNTAEMADHVSRGVRAEGVDVACTRVEDTRLEELLEADGIIMGSPTYYGTMAAELKAFIDESVRYHGKWVGKVGGAFSSSGAVGGGSQTTVLDILKAQLVHGMIVQGDAKSDHYGPVAVGKPDERSKAECERLGRKVAQLVKQLES